MKKAIELDPKYAEAHCNLGDALAREGRFAESLAALKRGHELGTKQPGWPYPSAEWVRQAEAKAAIEAKLPAFLKGEFQPADNQERLGLAGVCQDKKLHHTATGLYAAAFTADPRLADDLKVGHRYNGAFNAALAAAGQGEDAAKLDETARSRLRQEALNWLRADLTLLRQQLATGKPADRTEVQQHMRHWQQDTDLDGIRDAAALAKLPADEQKAFTQLWADMAALLKKAAENTEAETPAAKLNQAEEHLRAGRPDVVAPLLVEILNVRKTQLGPDHPDTLATMNQLGVAYWRLRQFDKSVPVFEELVKVREAKHGRDHMETVLAVANLGVNYRDAGRLKEAIALLEEAHQAAKNHPGLRWATGELLDAYAKAGENAKLANLLRERLAEARKALPKDSPQLAQQLATASLSLLQAKAFAEAESLLRECLAIREKTQPDVWSTFNTKSMLGGTLLGQKKYAGAEPLLLAGYEGMKQREKTIPEQGKIRLPEAVYRLIELYTATNKPDELKKWQAERAKYRKDAPMPGEKK